METVPSDSGEHERKETESSQKRLREALSKWRWRDAEYDLRRTDYANSLVSEYISACDQKGVCRYLFIDELLPHCAAEHLDALLITSSRHGWWDFAHKVLELGGSETHRLKTFDEAFDRASSDVLRRFILPHCNTQHLDHVLAAATRKGTWNVTDQLLKVGGSRTQHVQTTEEACERASDWDLRLYILPHCYEVLSHCSTEQLDHVLSIATTKGRWGLVAKVLEVGGSERHRARAIEEACARASDDELDGYILPHCTSDFMRSQLTHFAARGLWSSVGAVLEKNDNEMEAFYSDILPGITADQLHSLVTLLVNQCQWKSVGLVLKTLGRKVVEEASKRAEESDFISHILPQFTGCKLEPVLPHLVNRFMWKSLELVLEKGASKEHAREMVAECCKNWTYTTVLREIKKAKHVGIELLLQPLLETPFTNHLPPDAQSMALWYALQHNLWNVIRQACLSQVWEQVRRDLLRAAVAQKKWAVVKQWADHTLYLDQRWWALQEAYKHKQWDVMLLLAEHGLNQIELMWVRYRLAMYADWNVVLMMVEHGVDVTEIRELVENVMTARKTQSNPEKREALGLRWSQLRELEEKLTQASNRRVKMPSTAHDWSILIFYLHRHPRITSAGLLWLLQRAIEQSAWHVVMHLLALGMDTAQCDSLLTDMISRRQWGVCRVLLDQGVNVQSCLDALPVFMEMNQWTLVARIIEFIVDDDMKHQVTQRAMDSREGSVVWRCLRAMQHNRLSVKERKRLFSYAMDRGMWQLVKPLVEEEDSSGIRHRDTALLEAIEQRQWDAVDYCQLYGADIDTKDDLGETPLNRDTRNQEWKAVKELVVRGDDPNLLDKDGYSVLNKALCVRKYCTAKVLIEYQANIHTSVRSEYSYSQRHTPLQLLINKRRGELIHHTLMWCPDQAKGASDKGETTLHAIALGKSPELLYFQVVRGVNPLTLAEGKYSVLMYAVKNSYCPPSMVAECIRLGFITHQPALTQQCKVDIATGLKEFIVAGKSIITSPILLAVVRGLHVVANMLYESGACSPAELYEMYGQLLELEDPDTDTGRKLFKETEGEFLQYNTMLNIGAFLSSLKKMVSTPRSLESTCRLVISRCLTVRRRRERAVHQLSLPARSATGELYPEKLPLTEATKNYLLFSDLSDQKNAFLEMANALYCSDIYIDPDDESDFTVHLESDDDSFFLVVRRMPTMTTSVLSAVGAQVTSQTEVGSTGGHRCHIYGPWI